MELEQRNVTYPYHLDSRVLPGDFLYLRFDRFNRASQSWLLAAAPSRTGTRSALIVDLRFNGGGEAFSLSDLFTRFFPPRPRCRHVH